MIGKVFLDADLIIVDYSLDCSVDCSCFLESLWYTSGRTGLFWLFYTKALSAPSHPRTQLMRSVILFHCYKFLVSDPSLSIYPFDCPRRVCHFMPSMYVTIPRILKEADS